MFFLSTHINNKKALEILIRMRNQILPIRPKDPTMTVVDVRILQLLARRRVELDALGRDGLPGGQRERSGFDGIGRGDELVLSVSSR